MTQTSRLLLTLALVVLLPAAAAVAETAEQKGLRIAQSAADQRGGYGDLTVSGEMILTSQGGAQSTRRFDTQWVEIPGGGARSLLVFRWPGDIRNTALLTHANVGASDDQWLWLPSLNRVRRIAGSGRSGSFVGSEFAYEDMVDQEVDRFTYTWLHDEPCPTIAATCHVVERRPRDPSGYSVQRVWFDTENLHVQQVMYFDRRGAHLKTLTMTGYRLYEGRFWRAARMEMRNHLTGKATSLDWSDYRFDSGLNPTRLTPNALDRIR